MLTLSEGHLHALYKDARGTSWHGLLSYMKAGVEHIPMQIGEQRLMLEFVIPRHLSSADFEPKYIITGLNEHYILRRNYRELKIYNVNTYGVMEAIKEDDKLLSGAELAPVFVSLLQKAICYYISITPETRQFIFEARGNYSLLMAKSLANVNSDVLKKYTIKLIDELRPPFFGFEIDFSK